MTGNPALGSNGILEVDARDMVVTDTNGVPSVYIVEQEHPFDLDVTVEFGGFLKDSLMITFDVVYQYHAFNGGSGTLGTKTVTTDGRAIYSGADTRITVPANTLPQDVYDLVAKVRFKTPETKMAAFTNGVSIEIK